MRHFSINKATTTNVQKVTMTTDFTAQPAAIHDCRICSKIPVVLCCHMLPVYLYTCRLPLLQSPTRDVLEVPRRKSEGDIGRVSEQTKKTAAPNLPCRKNSVQVFSWIPTEMVHRSASFGERLAAHPPSVLAYTRWSVVLAVTALKSLSKTSALLKPSNHSNEQNL
jgi:hypothetical protein